MSTEIEDQKKQTLTNHENQMKQFQALYYLFKGKRDTDIKLFDENKQFSYSDILDIHEKINKKLELHEIVTNIVNITIGFDNKDIKNFGSWSEFKNTDWNISAKTKYITIEWDFNIILPNQLQNVPQTHTLRLRIGNNLKPSEMIHVFFQGDDECDIDEMRSEMVCKIDFVNAQICNELKLVVSGWYDSLAKNTEENKLIRFINKNHEKIQALVIFFFLTAGIILSNYLLNFFSTSQLLPSDSSQKQFLFITCSIPLLYIFYNLGDFYGTKIHRKTIHKLKRNSMFSLTKGDKNKKEEIILSNKKLLNQLALEIFCSFSVNLATYLIGLILKHYS